jgi:hypothetical protein
MRTGRAIAGVTMVAGVIAGCGNGGEARPSASSAAAAECEVNLQVGDVVRGGDVPPMARVILTGVQLNKKKGVARPYLVKLGNEAGVGIASKDGSHIERVVPLSKVTILARRAINSPDFCHVPSGEWLSPGLRGVIEGITLTNKVNGQPSFKDPEAGAPIGLHALNLSETLEDGGVSQTAPMETLKNLGYRAVNVG